MGKLDDQGRRNTDAGRRTLRTRRGRSMSSSMVDWVDWVDVDPLTSTGRSSWTSCWFHVFFISCFGGSPRKAPFGMKVVGVGVWGSYYIPSEDVVGALRMHTHICRSDSFNFGQVVPVTTPEDNGHVTGNSDESSRTPNPLAPRHPGSRFRIKGIFTKQQPIQQIRVMVLATSTPDSASSASSNHESLAVPGSGDKPPGGPIF